MTDAPTPTPAEPEITPSATAAEEQVPVEEQFPQAVTLPAESASIAAAAAAVSAGECVVLPTDTVYGIASDAFSQAAVQRLLDAKERSNDMPPPVLVAEPAMLRALAAKPPKAALELAEAFWPGALTLILNAQRATRLKVGQIDTVAVRVPDHDFTRELLRRTGPLAVSSANISGEPAAKTIDEARAQLGERVSVYVDAGACGGGVASTIIDFTCEEVGQVVRRGAIAFEDLVAKAPGLKDSLEPAPPPAEAVTDLEVEQASASTESGADSDPPKGVADSAKPAVES